MNLLVRTATHLKTVVLRTPVNESLDLKEAPLNEGAFLVSATPPNREGMGGGVLVTMARIYSSIW